MSRRHAVSVSIVLASLMVPAAVSALPGQTLAQFGSWSAQHVFLRGVTRTTDEMSGRPAFELLMADHGIGWRFRATTDGRTIQAETLAVGEGAGEPGSTPIRHDGKGYGMVFFRSMYGAAIAADFLASSQLGSVSDQVSHIRSSFYRGKHFGYEVTGGMLTITTLPAVSVDLAQLRRCIAHPGSCDE